MRIEHAEIGRQVVYTPFEGCHEKLLEYGVITGRNDKFVFVRYGCDIYSKATWPGDIEYTLWREG